VLGIHGEGLRSLLVLLGPVILLHVLDHRRQAFVSFDPEMAATVGVRVGLHDALFRASLAVAVARSVHAAGTLFVFAFLVLPAAGAMRVARSPAGVSAAAAVLALLAAGGGFAAAAHPRIDGPVGPTATAAACLLFGLCAVAGRRDG
jgi:ABC-type Mn2+/Zn2+ transport system permease subunit